MTIECKDLEWHQRGDYWYAQGINGVYSVGVSQAGPYWSCGTKSREFTNSIPEASTAANEHNKKQFQAIIEEWRKG